MERERVVQLFFFGFLAVMAYELYGVLAPFITSISWAILLAFLLHPALLVTQRLVRRRSLAALLVTVVVALGVLLPALWLSDSVAAEAKTLYGAIAQLAGSQSEPGAALNWLLQRRPMLAIAAGLERHGIRIQDWLPRLATEAARFTSNYLVSHFTSVARNLVSLVVGFAVTILTFYYLLRDGESYYETLRGLTPLHEDDKAVVFDTLSATLSAVMRGLMLTAVLQGVTIGLAYLVLRVPYWALLAILTAACGLLPVAGTALVWGPVALYLGYTAGWLPATVMAVWAAITVVIIDNFLKPLAMRRGTGLPTLALFFGIAGGMESYGPLGLFAGPAVIAVFAALLRVYRKTYGSTERRAA